MAKTATAIIEGLGPTPVRIHFRDDPDSEPYSHGHPASEITDFDTEVSNNTDVDANTTDRHAHGNAAQLALVTDGDHDVIVSGNPHGVTKTDVGLSINAVGDLVYGSAADTGAVLPIGAGRNLFLSPNAGLPVWGTFTDALDHEIFFAKDYATLQAAVTAAGAVGGTVICEGKTYSENLVCTSLNNITIIGVPGLTIVDGTTSHGLTVNGGGNLTFVDMAFKTTAGLGNTAFGIYVLGAATRLHFVRCQVLESDHNAIHIAGTANKIWITDCEISGAIDNFGITTVSANTDIAISGLICGTVSGANALNLGHIRGSVVGCPSIGTGSVRSIRLTGTSQEIAVGVNKTLGAISDIGTGNILGVNT